MIKSQINMINYWINFLMKVIDFVMHQVNEEVERVMRHCTVPRTISRSPSLRIEAASLEKPSNYELMFSKKLLVPIFTGSRIVDIDGNPIQVILVDKSGGDGELVAVPTSVPQPIKLEIVVLDGDFPNNKESWTTEEFNNNIVKERTGKRPLLTGELNLTMRDGIAPIEEIEFTDNSSWIRSRKFRVAVRVAPGSNQTVRIREGITEPFVVKDHRGECKCFISFYINLLFSSLIYMLKNLYYCQNNDLKKASLFSRKKSRSSQPI